MVLAVVAMKGFLRGWSEKLYEISDKNNLVMLFSCRETGEVFRGSVDACLMAPR